MRVEAASKNNSAKLINNPSRDLIVVPDRFNGTDETTDGSTAHGANLLLKS